MYAWFTNIVNDSASLHRLIIDEICIWETIRDLSEKNAKLEERTKQKDEEIQNLLLQLDECQTNLSKAM